MQISPSMESHEIKRCLLLGRKVMTNLDSILKNRDITLPTKVRLVKAMVFPVVMYGCESWTVKKAKHWIIDAFELWCWRMPGTSPGWSRVFETGMASPTYLFKYVIKDIKSNRMRIAQQENLVEKRGWVAWFTREINKTSRQEVCTTYVGRRCPSVLPKERRHWGLPGRILEAQA